MSYCPVCGNTDKEYECNCIKDATGEPKTVKVEIKEYDRQAYIDKLIYG